MNIEESFRHTGGNRTSTRIKLECQPCGKIRVSHSPHVQRGFRRNGVVGYDGLITALDLPATATSSAVIDTSDLKCQCQCQRTRQSIDGMNIIHSGDHLQGRNYSAGNRLPILWAVFQPPIRSASILKFEQPVGRTRITNAAATTISEPKFNNRQTSDQPDAFTISQDANTAAGHWVQSRPLAAFATHAISCCSGRIWR